MADNILPPEGQINGGAGTLILNPVEPLTGVGSKRQRRPSVRLGDIGVDPPYDSHSRRHPHKPYKPHHSFPSGKPSKTRTLTILTSPLETLGDSEEPNSNIDTWKFKDSTKKRASAKRVRSNWVSRIDDGDEKYSAGEDLDDGYREFDVENSESPFRDSMENLGVDGLHSKGRYQHDGVEICGPSDTDARDWNNDENGGEDGVRVWLNGLGLGRYAPVFQVHEVDDEVLPMLTLEDLKDMGISAVGTRRKMYCAIQKLGKGFS